MHHIASRQKQQRFKKRMRYQVKHRGHNSHNHQVPDSTSAQRHEQVTKLADRRVGEHAFKIGLKQGHPRADEGRNAT